MLFVSSVQSSDDWRDFLELPGKIYRDLPLWVPPLLSDLKKNLDNKRGSFFNDGFGSRAEFFLCREAGQAVGRIAAIRNERHLARHDDGVGFFGFFECVDRQDVAEILLRQAEGWLKQERLSVARGPTSFTLNDEAGIMIHGHDVLPPFLTAYTPAYYSRLVEACGYRKARDLLGFSLSMEGLDDGLFRFEKYFRKEEVNRISTRRVDKKDIENEARIIAEVFSTSWDRNWGAFPILPKDLVQGAKELGPYFDERLAYLAFVDEEPAGVFLAIPDPAEILREMNGKRNLKGVVKFFATRKKFRRIRLLLFGTLTEFRELPIASAMVREIQRCKSEFESLETIELFWILEDNRPTREMAESLGAVHNRTLRIYEKYL